MRMMKTLLLSVFVVFFTSACPLGCASRGELADRDTGQTNQSVDARRSQNWTKQRPRCPALVEEYPNPRLAGREVRKHCAFQGGLEQFEVSRRPPLLVSL
jgi:hypothetical protein